MNDSANQGTYRKRLTPFRRNSLVAAYLVLVYPVAVCQALEELVMVRIVESQHPARALLTPALLMPVVLALVHRQFLGQGQRTCLDRNRTLPKETFQTYRIQIVHEVIAPPKLRSFQAVQAMAQTQSSR
jgi:hypothetical protein